MNLRQHAIFFLMLISCSGTMKDNAARNQKVSFSEKEILKQLDLAFLGKPSKFYPQCRPQDVQYNFFLDLEHGYAYTAGSKIHLYADSARWIMVFEKSAYFNRSFNAGVELVYVGNCVDYIIDHFPERNCISNCRYITLIEQEEFQRIRSKSGQSDMETFELIDKDINELYIRDSLVHFDNNYLNYEKLGIKVREFKNPNKLISFESLVRYFHETNPSLISANEKEIRTNMPKDLPKLMTIDRFMYARSKMPSELETYKMISKILTTRDTGYWKPKEKANNSWKNWESGNL